MATGHRCPSCGTKLAAGATCGVCTAGRLVVEDATGSVAGGGDVELGTRRRWVGPLAVGAVVVAVGVGAAVTGGSGEEAVPPTTLPSSTTAAARRTTTTAPRATTTSTSLPDGWVTTAIRGPAFGQPLPATIYAMAMNGKLVKLELDSGAVSVRQLPPQPIVEPGMHAVLPVTGGVLVSNQWGGGSPSYLIPDIGPVQVVPDRRRMSTSNPDVVWEVVQDDRGQDASARLATPLGEALSAEIPFPLGAYVLGGDGGDGLVVGTADGSYRLTQSGAERISDRGLVALSGTTLLEVACDAAFRCSVQRRNGVTGEITASFPVSQATGWYWFDGWLSPDGRWYARYTNDERSSLVAFDLDTGQSVLVGANASNRFGYGSAVWSRDGRWLFFLENDGALHAWDSANPTDASLALDESVTVPPLAIVAAAP